MSLNELLQEKREDILRVAASRGAFNKDLHSLQRHIDVILAAEEKNQQGE